MPIAMSLQPSRASVYLNAGSEMQSGHAETVCWHCFFSRRHHIQLVHVIWSAGASDVLQNTLQSSLRWPCNDALLMSKQTQPVTWCLNCHLNCDCQSHTCCNNTLLCIGSTFSGREGGLFGLVECRTPPEEAPARSEAPAKVSGLSASGWYSPLPSSSLEPSRARFGS